jgi:RNA polymerase sigma factor (sigma-70 family)
MTDSEFEDGVKKYSRFASAYANRILSRPDPFLADDIVQSMWLSLWDRRDKLDNLNMGIIAIALRRRYADVYRVKRSYEYVMCNMDGQDSRYSGTRATLMETAFRGGKQQLGTVDVSDDPEHHMPDHMVKSIDRLPHQLRETFELWCFQGHTHARIADLLDIPLGTVLSRVYRAKKFLYNELKHHYEN